MLVFHKSIYKIQHLDWAITALILALAILLFLKKFKVPKNWLFLILYVNAPLLISLFMTSSAYNISFHLESIFHVFILNILIGNTFYWSINSVSNLRVFCQSLLLVWILINTFLLIVYVSGFNIYEEGIFAGLYENRNEFIVQSIFILYMALMTSEAPFKSFSSKFYSFINSLYVVIAGSMKGLVLLTLVLFIDKYRQSRSGKKILTAIIATSILCLLFITSDYLSQRALRFALIFLDPGQLKPNESAFLRSWLLVESLSLIADNLVTGIGFNNSRFLLVPEFFSAKGVIDGFYSHINYTELALSGGIFSLIIYYYPLIRCLISSATLPKWVINLIIMYLVMGLGMIQYDNAFFIFVYVLILRLPKIVSRT